MLSRTITARGAGCSSRGWSSDCKPATQTTPNAPAIRHASASLRPHTAHPATRRMQILVDRDEPVPLRRAHAPRATPTGRHCQPAMRRPGEAPGAQRILQTRHKKLMVLPPDHLSPKDLAVQCKASQLQGLCWTAKKNRATLLRPGSGWSAAAPAWQRQEGLNGHASAPAATATLWAAAAIERPVRSTRCVRR